ncbi:S66 peptidase family protein [Bowmanella yangjiangensis]|uniref:LD-carboxypeptidase n=1 Tax=Bowmanella yangjiangensis TaxID=2811230 RepID=A0ABS3CV40_9ALTE|nr:S66 peptidase family protein [Bowmanella yangjiangensis]MBN7820969.1 LD-carboxypeptidase [Bowmanella yangjiangensis]
MFHIPKPLKKGDTVAITAPSSGVPQAMHPRLDVVLAHLRNQGYHVIEGQCLRANHQHVSASKAHRTKELMDFLLDPQVDAILPPWGGEIGMDLLDALDYNQLATVRPKWLVGHSDISTLLNALTSKLGWCTAHTTNLMQMVPSESEPLTASALMPLSLASGQSFTQHASSHYQQHGVSFIEYPEQGLQLGPKSQWKILGQADEVECRGHLFGGCLDILIHLAGTEYFDINRFEQRSQGQGMILYLENAELSPPAMFRALQGLKYRGFFRHLNGLLIGRNAAPSHDPTFNDQQILTQLFADAPFPVIYDADIGHLPPNMTLLNGVLAVVKVSRASTSLTQYL